MGTGRGTRNFLLGLGDGSYLEIIGIDPDQPEPAQPRPFGLDELTEPRLVTWAVQVTDIDAVVAAARTAGFDPGDASVMSRTTPDGRIMQWRLTLQVKLRSLAAIHPDPATISTRLHALSADLEVRPGTKPTILATIAGPAGTLTVL
ncbi:VOC family protein [Nocardia vinacea]|uniref:VOC family protein n=1 Tax=Nocardia vinacea TaxID=96468 RepID=A0ABZ1YWZ1_9NOCA|nr:VOC family protein [Nocardia vinacea]